MIYQIDELVQERHNSSALVMEPRPPGYVIPVATHRYVCDRVHKWNRSNILDVHGWVRIFIANRGLRIKQCTRNSTGQRKWSMSNIGDVHGRSGPLSYSKAHEWSQQPVLYKLDEMASSDC